MDRARDPITVLELANRMGRSMVRGKHCLDVGQADAHQRL
jgi:hypothetical protein